MIAYHGTDKDAYTNITAEGFNVDVIKHSRRFGEGVYFSDKEDVKYYGEETIIAEIADSEIAFYSREDWQRIEDGLIRRYQYDYNHYIPQYIKTLGYKCLCIDWDGRGKELIVYDLSIINIQH